MTKMAFDFEDSKSFRDFSRLEMEQYLSGSTLQENIKDLREETWEEINQLVMGYAQGQELEKGRKVSLYRREWKLTYITRRMPRFFKMTSG